jgi:tape measure domain-containing protein
MSVEIDIQTRDDQLRKDVARINQELRKIANNAGQVSRSLTNAFSVNSLNKLSTSALAGSRNLGALERSAQSSFRTIKKEGAAAEKTTNALASSFKNLAITFGAAFSAHSFYKAGDELVAMNNKLKLLISDTREFANVQGQLYKIAAETRGMMSSSVDVYYRFGKSLERTGISQERLLKVTKAVNQAVAISAQPIESTNAALFQLGQGLAADALRGQELNSVLEQLPMLAEVLKRDLNLTSAELRNFAEQGKLTSAVVVGAIENQSKMLEKEFAKTAATAAQGVARLGGAFKKAMGELNIGLGASNSLYKFFDSLASKIDKLALVAGPGLFAVGNYLKRFRRDAEKTSTEVAILKRTLEGDISFSFAKDLIKAYRHLKPVISTVTEFQEKLSDIFDNLSNTFSAGFGEGLKDFSAPYIDGLKRIYESFKLLGGRIKELLPLLLPDIRGPVETIFTQTDRIVKTGYLKLMGTLTGMVRSSSRIVKGALEFLTAYQISDSLIERSFLNLMRSSSFEDVIVNFESLAEAISSTRWENQLTFIRDFSQSLKRIGRDIQDVMLYFGIFENRLLRIGNIRLDRLAEGFEVVARAAEEIWLSLIRPKLMTTLYVQIVEAQARIKTFVEGIEGTFNERLGRALVRNLIQVFKVVVSGIRGIISDLFEGKVGNIDLSELFVFKMGARVFESIKQVFIGAFKEIFDTIRGSATSAYAQMVEEIDSYSKKLFAGALSTVIAFGDAVKDVFYDIYDKVVGNSYWPDMIDGVNKYSSKLSASEASIRQFSSRIKDIFKELYAKIAASSAVEAITVRVQAKVAGIDFSYLSAEIKKRVAGAVIAAFGIALGGGFRRLGITYFFDDLMKPLVNALGGVAEPIADFLAKGATHIVVVLTQGILDFVNAMVRDIPQILGTVLDSMAGIEGYFTRLMGLAGPAGLLTTLLLGHGFLSSKAENKMDAFLGMFSGLGAFFQSFILRETRGVRVNPWAGLIVENPNRQMLLGGVVALMSGLLDSVSALSAGSIGAPLIATALMGGERAGGLLRRISIDILQGVGGIFQSLIDLAKRKSAGTAVGDFIGNLFGNIGKATTNTAKAAGPLTSMISSIVEFISDSFSSLPTRINDYISGKINWKDLLFGNDITEVVDDFGNIIEVSTSKWTRFADDIKSRWVGLVGSLKRTSIWQGLSAGFSDVIEGFSSLFANINLKESFKSYLDTAAQYFTDFRGNLSRTAAAGGAQGLVARVLFAATSPVAILAILATIALTFASTAKASNSFTDSVKETYQEMSTLGKTLVSIVTAITLYKVAMLSLISYQRGVAAGVAYLGASLVQLKNVFISLVTLPILFARALQGIYTAAAAILLNTSAWTLIFGGMNKIFAAAGAAAASAWAAAAALGWKGSLIAIGKWLAGAVAGIGLTALAAITVGAGALGALYLYFFGPDGSFFEKLEWVYDKLKEMLGFGEALAPKLKGLVNASPSTQFGEYSYSVRPQLESINFEKISSKDYDLLLKVSKETSEVVKQTEESYRIQGYLTKEQLDNYNKALNAQQRLLDAAPKSLNITGIKKAFAELNAAAVRTNLSFESRLKRTLDDLAGTYSKFYDEVVNQSNKYSTTELFNPGRIGIILREAWLAATNAPLKVQIELQQKLQEDFGKLGNVDQAMSAEEQQYLAKAVSERARLLAEYNDKKDSFLFTKKDKADLAALESKLKIVSDQVDTLIERYQRINPQRMLAKTFAKDLETFEDKLKDLGGIDSASLFNEKDRKAAQYLINDLELIRKKFSQIDENSPKNLRDRNKLLVEEIQKRRQIANIQEVAAATSFSEASFDFGAKITGLNVEDIKATFQQGVEGYDTWLNKAIELQKLQTKIANIPYDRASEESRKSYQEEYNKLKLEEIALQKELKATLKESTIGKFNTALSAAGFETFPVERFASLSKQAYDEIYGKADRLKTLNEDILKHRDAKTFDELKNQIQEIMTLTQELQKAINATLSPSASMANLLGTDIFRGAVLSANPKAKGLAEQKDKISRQLLDNALPPLSSEMTTALGRRGEQIDLEIAKLLEKPTQQKVSIFDRFNKFLEGSNIQLDLGSFMKIKDSGLAKALINQAHQIAKTLNSSGNAFLSDPAWVASQLGALERVQEKLNVLVETSLVSFQSKLDSLGEIGLDIDIESFLALGPGITDDYIIIAQEMKAINRILTSPNASKKEIENTLGAYQSLNELRRNMFKRDFSAGGLEEKLGAVVTDLDFSNLFKIPKESAEQAVAMLQEIEKLESLKRTLPRNQFAPYEAALQELKHILNKEMREAINSVSSMSTSLANDLNSVGIQVDQGVANLIGEDLAGYIWDQIDVIHDNLEVIRKGASPAEVNAAQKIIDDISDNIRDSLDNLKYDAAKEAGQRASEDLYNSLSDGLKDTLASRKSFKDFLKDLLDDFTNTIIDTFVNGLLDPLKGERGLFKRISKNLFSSIFNLGEEILPAEKSDKETPKLDGAVQQFDLASSSMFTKISSGLEMVLGQFGLGVAKGIGTILQMLSGGGSGGFSWLGAIVNIGMGVAGAFSGVAPVVDKSFTPILRAATGGWITGPGTETSDSIPALLSNREFIVKASSAKRFAPLLEAINEGRLPKFAEGGWAAGTASMFNDIKPSTSISNSRNATVNINITGDISRQTKSTIYEMLPDIANGVNGYNREVGYRG